MNFLERLARSPLLADGAIGTMIHARGVGFDVNFDSLNLAQPELVQSIHRAYVEAGADVIETNTFGANRFRFEAANVLDDVAEVNGRGVELAREIVRNSGRHDVFVAGAVGPSGLQLAPLGSLRAEDAFDAFRVQVAALADAGADLIVLETFSDLLEIEQALRAAKSACRLPVVAQMTFNRDDRTVMGTTPEDAARRLLELGADVIGANCSTGPRSMLFVTQRMENSLREAHNGQPLVSAMPNAGFPEVQGGRLIYPATPSYFADYAARFLDAGIRLIGGCCGSTPDHIHAMRRVLDDRVLNGAKTFTRAEPSRPIVSPQRATPPADSPPPTRLAAALEAGSLVVTVEVEPPKGHETEAIEDVAKMLKQAGATVLDISDLPMARMRMSALALALRIQDRAGIETVLHFPVRGRNLLRVQGDLLAAHTLNIRNLFVAMGDPTSIGEYPQANDHHDIVPTGLTQLIKEKFNHGLDSAGASIGKPCSFVVGVAANLTPSDMDKEARLLKKKIESGADFALTQPVFDPVVARTFIAHYERLFGPLALPIFAGVLPLASARHAEFLKNEVPGMAMPDRVVERLRGATKSRTEGAAIAYDIIGQLRDFVQGIYFIPAFGRYDIVARLIESTVATG